jgi:hypothetical protein
LSVKTRPLHKNNIIKFKAALIGLILSGCTVMPTGDEPKWFKYQSYAVGVSIESLSECGPAVARNFLHWQTGINIQREQARAMYRTPFWWQYYQIQQFVNHGGGNIRLDSWASNPINTIKPGEKIIAHVYNTHFVTVEFLRDGYLTVYDTNSGISQKSFAQFMSGVSHDSYLIGGLL